MSIAGGLHKALERGQEVGCQVVQIFSRYRMRWSAKGLSETEVAAFQGAKEKTRVAPVALHNSYLINLASPLPEVRKKSLSVLIEEMAWANLEQEGPP